MGVFDPKVERVLANLPPQERTILEQCYLALMAQTRIDGLTGLNNQAAFQEDLEVAVRRAQRTDGTISLLVLDINDMKKHNDGPGSHEVGNRVIIGVARTMQESRRFDERVYRSGIGDEMAIIYQGLDPCAALVAGQRLVRNLDALTIQANLGGNRIQIRPTVAGGIAGLPHHAKTAIELYTNADKAMYAAKREGKRDGINNIMIFESVSHG